MRPMLRRAALAVACGSLLLSGGCAPIGAGETRLTAIFADSAGLFVGNDVGVLGVPVGSVEQISPRGDVVEVELEVDPDLDLPADVGAVVVSRSVATDRYVELTPVHASGPTLDPGAEIPLERTRNPVEFDELLESLGEFSEGITGADGEAKALRELLSAGAGALDRRGEDVNRTIRSLSGAAGALSGQREEIAGTIEELDALTTLLADNGHTIDEFIESVTDATDLFADERHRFGRALTSLSRALRSLARFVRENRAELGDAMTGLTEVTESLLEHEAELAEALETTPITFENIGRAISNEDRLRVKLPLRHLSPVPEVTEGVCEVLPAVVCDNLGTDPDLAEILAGLEGGDR